MSGGVHYNLLHAFQIFKKKEKSLLQFSGQMQLLDPMQYFSIPVHHHDPISIYLLNL